MFTLPSFHPLSFDAPPLASLLLSLLLFQALLRRETLIKPGFQATLNPTAPDFHLSPGVFYLKEIDSEYRRIYTEYGVSS
jgi:hypothetical protein